MTRGLKQPAVVRLLDKTRFDAQTGCWIWTASQTSGGYGVFKIPGVATQAHRAAYVLLAGPVPTGLHLDHLCRNKLCVNPDHLEPVTQAENNRRACAVKTHCPQGHEYSSDNLVWRQSRQTRECKQCNRDRARRNYRAKNRTAEVPAGVA